MKKQIILIIIATCLLAACVGGNLTASALSSPALDDLRSLTVTGTATLTVDADGCEFYGSVTTLAETLSDAEKNSTAAFRKISVAFAPYGEVIERSYNVCPSRVGSGYTAYRYLQFKASSTDNAAEIRRELSNAGLTEICGMTYTSENDSEYRAQALSMALENAQNTAKAMGAEGRLIKAEETYCYPDGCSTSGKITYTASVRAHFRKAPEPRKNVNGDNNETSAEDKTKDRKENGNTNENNNTDNGNTNYIIKNHK